MAAQSEAEGVQGRAVMQGCRGAGTSQGEGSRAKKRHFEEGQGRAAPMRNWQHHTSGEGLQLSTSHEPCSACSAQRTQVKVDVSAARPRRDAGCLAGVSEVPQRLAVVLLRTLACSREG